MKVSECIDGASSHTALEAIGVAERNQKMLLSAIPRKLLEREDKLVDTFIRHKGNSFTKLRALYDFMDELYVAIGSFTPCGPGCTSCCHYPVELSGLEIELIVRETGRKRRKLVGSPQNFHGDPCPFLKDGRCDIYASRPYVCRRHYMLAPSAFWCVPERSMTANFPMIQFTEVERVLRSLVTDDSADSIQKWDIRQVF